MDAMHQAVQMPLNTLATIPIVELSAVVSWAQRRQADFPAFGPWLIDTCRHEIERRYSDGAMEMGFLFVPDLNCSELADFLLGSFVLLRGSTGEAFEQFADHLLRHVLVLAGTTLEVQFGEIESCPR